MTIILSCRHEVEDFNHAYNIITKAIGREGEKVLEYSTVFGACEDLRRQNGVLFDNEETAHEWLQTEDW